ncbi:MAG TPA: nuclear transport factor 2 family protein [Chitinophaga sp.]
MAQSKNEQIIRDLERQEMEAVLKGDTVTLFEQLWAPELLVNNPANMVITRPQIVELIKTGKINYETFERIIEQISMVDNTAIVMGREELKPQGVTDHAGKQLTRRFTNICIKRHDQWRLAGRQATIVTVQ